VRGGHAQIVDANKNVGAWKDRVALAASLAMTGLELFEGPLVLRAHIELVRPKGHIGARGLKPSAPPYPIVKPDLTKYVRALEDALKGIVWRDDAQVVRHDTMKAYGLRDRVSIVVAPMVLETVP
jgi:Holliday junction resolvase RusA-like endonuclease